MSTKVPRLTHWAVAKAQVGLSYLFLLGFFAAIGGQGLGYFKVDITSELKDVLMLVMSFWFMRQRVSGEDAPSTDTVANPPAPAPTATTEVKTS